MSASNKMQSCTDHVHHLDSKTLKPFIESMGAVLLSVVMLPVSKSCRTFVHQYRQIADVMHDSDITFAQINALGNGGALAQFNISTFPHLLLFQGFDDFRAYRGVFNETEILVYLNRFVQFPVLSKISPTSLPKFKMSSDVVVVGYVAAEDEISQGQFELLAKTIHPEYAFGITNDLALAKTEGIDMPGVAVYKASDGEKNALPLADNIDEMTASLRKAARPLIVDLAPELHEGLLDMGIPFAYVFVNASEQRTRVREEIEPLAREYRQDIQFGIADPVRTEDIVDDLHLNISRLPAFAIREPTSNQRYPMNETNASFNDALKGFVQDYLNGKLKPTIKSEPIPGKSKDALVKVVGLNFQEIVLDTAKDVLLTYCITPCGPCDVLQPTLAALALLYASSSKLKDKVAIAKVMYDENDTPERRVRAFPTIKLFPAASKSESVTFLGPRTLDALADFIRDYGSHNGDLSDSEEKQILGEGMSAAPLEQQVCMYENGEC